ncbi:hypothetical protein ROZALSC1DRAFT_28415, partial [Rozella allomycis CSF55]
DFTTRLLQCLQEHSPKYLDPLVRDHTHDPHFDVEKHEKFLRDTAKDIIDKCLPGSPISVEDFENATRKWKDTPMEDADIQKVVKDIIQVFSLKDKRIIRKNPIDDEKQEPNIPKPGFIRGKELIVENNNETDSIMNARKYSLLELIWASTLTLCVLFLLVTHFKRKKETYNCESPPPFANATAPPFIVSVISSYVPKFCPGRRFCGNRGIFNDSIPIFK